MTTKERLVAEIARQKAMEVRSVNQPNPTLATIFIQQVREMNLQQMTKA